MPEPVLNDRVDLTKFRALVEVLHSSIHERPGRQAKLRIDIMAPTNVVEFHVLLRQHRDRVHAYIRYQFVLLDAISEELGEQK